MSEWLKEHAWKVCVSQKGIVGSNPTLSANNIVYQLDITIAPNLTPNYKQLGVLLLRQTFIFFLIKGLSFIDLFIT